MCGVLFYMLEPLAKISRVTFSLVEEALDLRDVPTTAGAISALTNKQVGPHDLYQEHAYLLDTGQSNYI